MPAYPLTATISPGSPLLQSLADRFSKEKTPKTQPNSYLNWISPCGNDSVENSHEFTHSIETPHDILSHELNQRILVLVEQLFNEWKPASNQEEVTCSSSTCSYSSLSDKDSTYGSLSSIKIPNSFNSLTSTNSSFANCESLYDSSFSFTETSYPLTLIEKSKDSLVFQIEIIKSESVNLNNELATPLFIQGSKKRILCIPLDKTAARNSNVFQESYTYQIQLVESSETRPTPYLLSIRSALKPGVLLQLAENGYSKNFREIHESLCQRVTEILCLVINSKFDFPPTEDCDLEGNSMPGHGEEMIFSEIEIPRSAPMAIPEKKSGQKRTPREAPSERHFSSPDLSSNALSKLWDQNSARLLNGFDSSPFFPTLSKK
jgi:hypothetical protein